MARICNILLNLTKNPGFDSFPPTEVITEYPVHPVSHTCVIS